MVMVMIIANIGYDDDNDGGGDDDLTIMIMNDNEL